MHRRRDGSRSLRHNARVWLGCRLDDIKFTELRGLHTVVERRIDLDSLAADLGHYLEGSLDYFAKGGPNFTPVDHLDFGASDDTSRSKLGLKLARRIYAVRNSITHSKPSARRYSPYTDDLELAREVPLIRIAAEQLLTLDADRP